MALTTAGQVGVLRGCPPGAARCVSSPKTFPGPRRACAHHNQTQRRWRAAARPPPRCPPHGSQAGEQLWVSGTDDADAAPLPPVTNWAGVPSAQWCRGDGPSSYLGLLTFFLLLTTSPLAFAGAGCSALRPQATTPAQPRAEPAQPRSSPGPKEPCRSVAAPCCFLPAPCTRYDISVNTCTTCRLRSTGNDVFHLSLHGSLPVPPQPELSLPGLPLPVGLW